MVAMTLGSCALSSTSVSRDLVLPEHTLYKCIQTHTHCINVYYGISQRDAKTGKCFVLLFKHFALINFFINGYPRKWSLISQAKIYIICTNNRGIVKKYELKDLIAIFPRM